MHLVAATLDITGRGFEFSAPRRDAVAVNNPSPYRLRWAILAGVWFVSATFGLAVTSLPPLVVQIETDLNMSHAAMGSVLGA